MPDNVEPLHNGISRSFSSIGGWLCNLIARHCAELISLPVSTSEVSDKDLNYKTTSVAIMEPIEISSSDSDWDIDDTPETDPSTFRDSSSSSSHRILPNWASARDTNSAYRGNGGQYQRVTSPKRASASNGNPLNTNVNSQAKSQLQLVARSNKFSGDFNHHKENRSSINGGKRTLPPTLLPRGPNDRSKNLVENVSKYEIQDARGNGSLGSTFIARRNPMEVPFELSNDDVVMFAGSTSKVLVPSLIHNYAPVQQFASTRITPVQQFASTSITPVQQFASTSITPYRSSDEREPEHDERFVYQAALEDISQPKLEANLPEGLLSVNLLRHQKIALAWAIQKENRSSPSVGGFLADDQGLGKTISMIALIQMQKYLEEKSKSDVPPKQETEAFNLDDDEDDKIKESGECSDTRIVPKASISVKAITKGKQVGGTLVVCPASILRQWARELDEKVPEEAKLSVLLYHGSNRTKDPSELGKYDIVVTTYSIVTNEVPKQPLVDEDGEEDKNGEAYGLSSVFSINKKRKKSGNIRKKGKKGPNTLESSFDYGCGALAKVRWLRVILDEAQTIKNHRTLIARACCSLKAKKRWCLSGTPIQNTVDDLYSYFRFLRYAPYFNYKSFYADLKVPISRNPVLGFKKLQAVLRAVMLRRTKGTLLDGEPIVKLPPKSVCLTKVDFSNEERSFYAKLEADSRSQFKAYAAAGTLNQNYANILLMLLRLRQACNHPLLVKGFNRDLVGKESFEMATRLPRDMLVNLLNLLETSLAICCVCNDPPDDAVVTMCGHVFCYQCVFDYISGDDNTCPAPECKNQLGDDVVFSKASLRSSLSGDHDDGPSNIFTSLEKSIVMQTDYCSSKIKAVLEILSSLNCPTLDPKSSMSWNEDGVSGKKEPSTNVQLPSKAIVFSQWTRMLDLVEMSLKQTYIVYRRLDGTMTLGARDKAVKDFNTNPEVTVMLMSLKAGNLGLNMVAACHVILLDLWWNPTTEDQAVDRAHRIGQTREVTVSRLTIRDTVEDRILALQEDKRDMVASAFGEDHGGRSGKLTADDLKFLFMGQN